MLKKIWCFLLFVAVQVGHLLESRPDYEDLIQAGIVKDAGIAPGLIGVKRKLERQMTANQINALLESRPEPQELIAMRIMEDPFRVSGNLQATRKALKKKMLMSNLENKIMSRPNPQEITNSSIFEESDDNWQESYIHNKTVLEGYRAARRESWGLQDFADSFDQMDGEGDDDDDDDDEELTDGTDSYLDYDMEDEEADYYARMLEQEMASERGRDFQQTLEAQQLYEQQLYEQQKQEYEAVLMQHEQAQRENNDSDDGRTLRRRFGIALKGKWTFLCCGSRDLFELF